jgi:hypothetical protein
MRFFANRTFTLTNTASLLMFFGMFGSIFLFSQFFQTVQGYSPLRAGLLFLPWTGMPIFVAPIAGTLSDRIGGAQIMSVGLILQAIGLGWIATVITPTVAYSQLVAPFALSGIGMGLFFAPVANVILGAVRPEEEGQASGANNAIRELGGVFGVAVLASILRQLRQLQLRPKLRQRAHASDLDRRSHRRSRCPRRPRHTSHRTDDQSPRPRYRRGLNLHPTAGKQPATRGCFPASSVRKFACL